MNNVERLAEWLYSRERRPYSWEQLDEIDEMTQRAKEGWLREARSLLAQATEWGWVQLANNQPIDLSERLRQGWDLGYRRVEPLEGK